MRRWKPFDLGNLVTNRVRRFTTDWTACRRTKCGGDCLLLLLLFFTAELKGWRPVKARVAQLVCCRQDLSFISCSKGLRLLVLCRSYHPIGAIESNRWLSRQDGQYLDPLFKTLRYSFAEILVFPLHVFCVAHSAISTSCNVIVTSLKLFKENRSL